MKSKTIWVPFLISGILTACGSPVRLDDSPAQIENRSTAEAAAAEQATREAATGADSEGLSAAEREVTTVKADPPPQADPLQEKDTLLARRSVFFDYDSFTIREEFRPIVEAHARYLISNPDKNLVLQGNTDERGSREYNVALGQKRAEAVRRALTILGVNDRQLEAVSFGEERPRAIGQTETSFAQNRRADLDYQ